MKQSAIEGGLPVLTELERPSEEEGAGLAQSVCSRLTLSKPCPISFHPKASNSIIFGYVVANDSASVSNTDCDNTLCMWPGVQREIDDR